MSAVIAIAKRDIKSSFYSLKGSAIFWFFLFLMGIFFQSSLSSYVEFQQRALSMGGQAPTLEQLLNAVYSYFQFMIFLIIPAVTMASFSEEKSNQSIKLLSTAPITSLQIVLGKYLACFFLMLLVLLSSSVFSIYTVSYGDPDLGIILTSHIGLLLVISAQVAFGIWISSMTSNQFIAFLFTMCGMFLLMILSWIAPNITSNSNTESFFKYLASNTHLDPFLKGMISVADVTYFVIFTVLFLFLTNLSLDSQRWK